MPDKKPSLLRCRQCRKEIAQDRATAASWLITTIWGEMDLANALVCCSFACLNPQIASFAARELLGVN